MTPPVLFGRAGATRAGSRRVDVPIDEASFAANDAATVAVPEALPDLTPESLTPRERRVVDAVATWRTRLLELGGESALADISLLGAAAVDLTAAHPSGIAQLFAGRPTLLSNLIRERAALAAARRRARTVLARADELAQRYGVAPTYLAIGIASWTQWEAAESAVTEEAAADGETPVALPADAETPVALPADADIPLDGGAVGPAASSRPPRVTPRTIRAPLLLRPLRLTAHAESDMDVVLEPSVEVNPVLVRALLAAGVELDAPALARETMTHSGFTPRQVLNHLRDLGENALSDFTFGYHLVLGPFVHPGQVLVEDLEARRLDLAQHDVVAALAGDPEAMQSVRRRLPDLVAGDRDPNAERGVGDLDPSQQHAIDAVASGAHLFIDAPPGADVASTVAGLLADAAASGRHVLYVPGSRRAGQGLSEAMHAAGLEGLLLDLSADTHWRSAAGARLAAGADLAPPAIDDDALQRTRTDLVEVRARMTGYMAALHARREPWGVSAHDALQALASLTSAPVSPRTKVRLDPQTVRILDAERRKEARDRLAEAAELDAFAIRPSETEWYGAALTDDERAREAVERVGRLSETALPAIRRRIAEVSAETGLDRAETLRAWGEQLDMLDGVREALDVFQPVIFERSATDLVAATATRQWRAEHGVDLRWRVRRRLRRQARDMVRPGRAVHDLHTALVHVQEQREAWRRHCAAGGWPRLPEGLAQIEAEHRAVERDVRALEYVLAPTAGGGRLLEAPLGELEARFRRLAADVAALERLPERTRVLDRLKAMGLKDLLADLAERQVPIEMVGLELDLAWWSSVFEEILRADPALAGYDGPTLGALADRLRELDAAQVDSLPGPVLRSAVAHVERVLQESPEAGELLEALASERVRDPREAVDRLGPLAGTLRPCWLVAPMQIPQMLSPTRKVDVVILDAAQHVPVEQAVPAISRARQVVIVGDSRRAALNAPGAPRGIVDALAELLPRVTLSADRVVREPGLMAFLGEHGYSDVIRWVPNPGRGSTVRLDVVDGFGTPAPGSELVESPPAEVDHVVDLVIDHALSRPQESLAVLTVSTRHADRVREAVLSAVADSPAIRDFFAAERPEPFAVLDLDSAAGVRRDAVVFSLGLGKTPHGRVMHRFGRVSDADGAGLLIDVIDACRRRLTVVSCFGPGDLDRWRLRTPGPVLLADLLEAAQAGGALPASIPEEGEPDRLLHDLAGRLWQLGLTVVPRYGVPGGVRIPLAISHPRVPDEMLLAVLTDDADYVRQECLRIRDRHDVQRLTERGWGVHMAFSTAVFLDPQAEAEQILAAALAILEGRRAAGGRFVDVPPVLAEAGWDSVVGEVAGGPAQGLAEEAAPQSRPDAGADGDSAGPALPG